MRIGDICVFDKSSPNGICDPWENKYRFIRRLEGLEDHIIAKRSGLRRRNNELRELTRLGEAPPTKGEVISVIVLRLPILTNLANAIWKNSKIREIRCSFSAGATKAAEPSDAV